MDVDHPAMNSSLTSGIWEPKVLVSFHRALHEEPYPTSRIVLGLPNSRMFSNVTIMRSCRHNDAVPIQSIFQEYKSLSTHKYFFPKLTIPSRIQKKDFKIIYNSQ
jgi:hypothetical protein